MPTIPVAVWLALFATLLAPSPARVCVTIEPVPTLADYKRDGALRADALAGIRRTQAIFLGEALSSSETAATFKVTRVWQGEVTTPLTLRGPVQLLADGSKVWTSDIASDFKIGASYLVVADGPTLADARPNGCSTALASKSKAAIQILDFLTKSYPARRSDR